MLRVRSSEMRRAKRVVGVAIAFLGWLAAFVVEHVLGQALGSRWPHLDTISNIVLAAIAVVVGVIASMPRYWPNQIARSARWAALAAALFAGGWLVPRTLSVAADLWAVSWLLAALCAWRAYRLGRGVRAYAADV